MLIHVMRWWSLPKLGSKFLTAFLTQRFLTFFLIQAFHFQYLSTCQAHQLSYLHKTLISITSNNLNPENKKHLKGGFNEYVIKLTSSFKTTRTRFIIRDKTQEWRRHNSINLKATQKLKWWRTQQKSWNCEPQFEFQSVCALILEHAVEILELKMWEWIKNTKLVLVVAGATDK